MLRSTSLGCFGIIVLGGISAGPAFADSRFDISPQLISFYDSNIARSSEALAQERGLHRAEFVFNPSLDIRTATPFGAHAITLEANVGYDIHTRNSRLNRLRASVAAGGKVKLGPCTTALSGSLARHQSDLEDVFDAQVVKNTETTDRIAADARCGGAIGIVPLLSASHEDGWNSNEQRRVADYHGNEVGAGLAYVQPTFGELSVRGDFDSVRYPHRESFGGLLSDGYDVTSIAGRYDRHVGARLQLGVGLAWSSVDPRGVGRKFSGFTPSADLDYILGDRAKLHLDYSRSVRPASFGRGDYMLLTQYSGELDYALTPRTSVSAGASLARRNIHGNIDPLFLSSDRRESAFVKVAYNPSRRLSASFEVRHERRTADPAIFDFSSTRAILTLRAHLG